MKTIKAMPYIICFTFGVRTCHENLFPMKKPIVDQCSLPNESKIRPLTFYKLYGILACYESV